MSGKRQTRETVISRRDALSADARESASGKIADAVVELIAHLPRRSIVALYAPKGTEVDTSAIDARARASGMRVAYPRIVDGERRLAFHEVTTDELVPARLGLREPRAEATAVELASIAAFVIPGLAFDRDGWRVGWGRGYYDATLAAVPDVLRIGLAFDCQVVDAVPHDPHDAPLDFVVTEVAVYRAPST